VPAYKSKFQTLSANRQYPWSGAKDADIVLVLVDAAKGLDEETEEVFASLSKV